MGGVLFQNYPKTMSFYVFSLLSLETYFPYQFYAKQYDDFTLGEVYYYFQ